MGSIISYLIGRSEARRNVLEKNQRGGFKKIWKTLFGTKAMNQVKLVSVIATFLVSFIIYTSFMVMSSFVTRSNIFSKMTLKPR